MFGYIKFYILLFVQLKISSYADIKGISVFQMKQAIRYFTMILFNDKILLRMSGQLRACFANILICRRNEQCGQLITRNYLFIHDRDKAASSWHNTKATFHKHRILLQKNDSTVWSYTQLRLHIHYRKICRDSRMNVDRRWFCYIPDITFVTHSITNYCGCLM